MIGAQDGNKSSLGSILKHVEVIEQSFMEHVVEPIMEPWWNLWFSAYGGSYDSCGGPLA